MLKAFFVHIPKTAGKSVRQSLRTHNLLANPGYEKKEREHHFGSKSAKRVKGSHLSFDTELWPSYSELSKYKESEFSFTVLRNPYDMLYSYYSHYIDSSKTKNWIDNGWANVNGHHGIDSFEKFIDIYTSIDPKDWHVPSLCENLFGQIFSEEKRLLVDKAIFVERLEEGLSEICDILRPGSKITIPRLNTSPRRKKDYRLAYSDSMIEKVRKKCSWELESFGYSFDFKEPDHGKTIIDLGLYV